MMISNSSQNDRGGPTEVELLDVKQTARLINTSTRTVYRLVANGGMPNPVKLGSLVRWRRSEIEAWIAGGCTEVVPESQASK